MQNWGAPAVKRMGERNLGVNQSQAVLLQLERLKKWGRDSRGMDRRADIMKEARLCELLRSHPAANGVGSFDDQGFPPCACQDNRRAETIGPETDNDAVVFRAAE